MNKGSFQIPLKKEKLPQPWGYVAVYTWGKGMMMETRGSDDNACLL